MILSLIVPTHNRPQALARCLQALLALSPAQLEIVVVDDGSEPPVFVPQGVRLIRQPQAGPAAARNRGARVAGGEWLIFMDDDCEPGPGWWESLLAAVERYPGAALGGHTRNLLKDNPYAEASQSLVDFLYDYHESQASASRFFTSNNLIIPRQDFLEVGGFDTSFPRAAGEDREFLLRWIKTGRTARWEKSIVVWHAHNLTLLKFCRQHFQYGQAARRYWKLRGDSVRLERPDFYTKLLRWPCRQGLSPRALIQSLLFILSQAANAAGFFTSKLEVDERRRESGSGKN